MHEASTRRFIAAALAVAAMGVMTATAQAGTVTDDLSGGDPVGTIVTGGGVELQPAIDETFDTALPAAWQPMPWTMGVGSASVAGGNLVLDRTRVDTGVSAVPESRLRFRVKLGDQPNQHIGFAKDFNDPLWAAFSTGSGSSAVITARTRDTAPPEQATPPATPVTFTDSHDFQIDWTGGQIVYRVDNAIIATHTPPATPGMTVQASDFDDSVSLPIESLSYRKPGSGTYTSKILDGGDARVAGLTFTPATTTPAGTTVTYQAQSSPSAAGPWTAFTTPANTPPARFVRYRAVMSSTNAETPRIAGASVDFRVDSVAPAVTVGAVSVNGTTARVPFSSDDAKATYRCSLDGGAFAPCSSPAQFGGLAVGPHAVAVRARDAVGNERTASASFTVSAPQGSAPDAKAPRIAGPRSAKVSRNGKVKLRLTCPVDEATCSVKVSLHRNGKTLAKKTITIDGGDSRTVSLRLSKSIRRLVVQRGELRVKLAITARDDAGNRSSRTKRLTLKAPAP